MTETINNFLRDYIQSYEELEVLLWLRTHARVFWDVDSVVDRLHLSVVATREALLALCRSGLLVIQDEHGTPVFAYRPDDPALRAAVAGLARAYKKDKLVVLKQINENALARVYRAGGRSFHPSPATGGEDE